MRRALYFRVGCFLRIILGSIRFFTEKGELMKFPRLGYYTRYMVARYLGVCKQTVINWEKNGKFLPDKVLDDGMRLYFHTRVIKFAKTKPKHKRMRY